MILGLTARMLTEPDPRLLARFAVNFGWKGLRAVQRYQRGLRRGETVPAFMIISVTNDCNLRCQGCWVTTSPVAHLAPATLDRIIRESKQRGSSFFGILGGEPLMYPGLLDVLAQHPDCYFQVFTNGTVLTPAIARRLRQLGNVTPLISLEGLAAVSDERRGGHGVYQRTLDSLAICRRERLITGVATSVCQSNFAEVVSEQHIRELIRHGALYVWYYIYRPAGGNPCPELALTREQILALRRFIVEIRCRVPIIVVDAYWDHEGRALCPAAVGISHHVNPRGDIEPCPPIQFACDNVADGNLMDTMRDSAFLRDFRRLATTATRGCVFLEKPGELADFMEQHGARDATGRGTGLAELRRLPSLPDHHQPGAEIPEKSWMYRFAKRNWFFGFGAYG